MCSKMVYYVYFNVLEDFAWKLVTKFKQNYGQELKKIGIVKGIGWIVARF